MKMKATLFSLCLAIGALAITACSKEDNNDREEEATFQAVQFRMAEEGFGTETELTRASSIPSAPALSEVGDCETETTVESEPAEKPTAATRGVTTPTHYTIRAYLNGAVYREIKGTFTATGFTPDAGSAAEIELRRKKTYDIVCFNDQVTPVGNKLEVTLANAATARIGRKRVTLITTDQTINLSARHVGVRVRTQIVAKKDIPTAITNKLQSTGNNIPQKVSYNPTDGSYTSLSDAAMNNIPNDSPASTEAKYTASNYGKTYAYTSTADYHYFLPTTEVANLKLNITGGKIFWKPLNGDINKLANGNHTFAANGTYCIKVKMNPKYTYLFNDGSSGFLSNAGARKPVGIVVDFDKRIAVALKNAGTEIKWSDGSQKETQSNTTMAVRDAFDMFKDFNDYTWSTTYSKNTIIRGNDAINYPAFYAAGQYKPANTTSADAIYSRRWHLPTMGEWSRLLSTLGLVDLSTHSLDPSKSEWEWYGNLVDEAFTRVGGKLVYPGFFNSSYWTTEEYMVGFVDIVVLPDFRFSLAGSQKKQTRLVRPFINY